MSRHFAKFLDTVWYASIGLFLGLTGGMVLAVIMIFRGARKIDAMPGTEPFNDPTFFDYGNEAVAGYIGQDLFQVGGTAAVILLMIAIVSRVGYGERARLFPKVGSKLASAVRILALLTCFVSFGFGGNTAGEMNSAWPGLYDPEATDAELAQRREAFEDQHKASERIMRITWLTGFLAMVISPWCRRIADTPLQSSDGKEDHQKENIAAQEA